MIANPVRKTSLQIIDQLLEQLNNVGPVATREAGSSDKPLVSVVVQYDDPQPLNDVLPVLQKLFRECGNQFTQSALSKADEQEPDGELPSLGVGEASEFLKKCVVGIDPRRPAVRATDEWTSDLREVLTGMRQALRHG